MSETACASSLTDRASDPAFLCALLALAALASWAPPTKAASEGKALDSELIILLLLPAMSPE